jgi:hypothetical protein
MMASTGIDGVAESASYGLKRPPTAERIWLFGRSGLRGAGPVSLAARGLSAVLADQTGGPRVDAMRNGSE